jgi:hypothetical protein
VTVSVQDLDYEGRATFRPANATSPALRLVTPASHSGLLVQPLGSAEAAPTIVGSGVATLGGLGVSGPVLHVRTAGTPADADWTAATPAMAIPPIGTIVVVLGTAKIYVKTATAAAWASSVALT